VPPDPLAGPSPAPAPARPAGLGGLAGLPGLAGPGRTGSRLLAGAVIAAVMVAVLILVVTLFAPGHRKSPAVTSASLAGTLVDPGGYRTQEVAFSPDGKTIAATVQGAGPDDGRLGLWTSSSGQPSAVLTSPAGGAVRGLAFSPASATALAVAGTGGIDLWNLATRQVSSHPDPAGQAAAGVAYAPGASTVAELSDGGGIYRLVLPAGSWLPGLLPGAGPVSAGQLGYSPDGTLLAAASPAGTVRVWKVSGGSPAVLAGAVTGPFAQLAAFSPDSKTLAVAGSGGQVRLWDTASGTFSSPLTDPGRRPQAVAFSPNGATLAAGDHDGAVYLWSLASRTETVISTPGLSAGGVTSLAFSPDGKVLAVAGDTAARVYLYSLSYAGS
jgi:hypothetical protein